MRSESSKPRSRLVYVDSSFSRSRPCESAPKCCGIDCTSTTSDWTAVANDDHLLMEPNGDRSNDLQLVPAVHLFTGVGRNHVTLFEAGLCGGRIGKDRVTSTPWPGRTPNLAATSLASSSISTPMYARATLPLLINCCETQRARLLGMAKPIPLYPPRRKRDGGVDADHLAVEIDQRPAGIAGIDGGRRSAGSLGPFARRKRTLHRVIMPAPDSVLQTPRGCRWLYHPIADFHLAGIAEDGHRQLFLGLDASTAGRFLRRS